MEQHQFWEETRKSFDEKKDLSDFKTWEEVRRIPLYTYHELVKEYADDVLRLMKHRERFEREKGLWHSLLVEPKAGHTDESYQAALYDFQTGENDPVIQTTGFRLKSLHHLLTFEHLAQCCINEYDTIVEFGGGIGDTARTILDGGFNGDYYIYDFPEIQRISDYYLAGRAKMVNAFPVVKEKTGKTLLLATWSLSEAPIELRNRVAAWVKRNMADYFILFQSDFYGMSNQKYFIEEWPFKSDSFYRFMPLKFHPAQGGNWYMMGTQWTA